MAHLHDVIDDDLHFIIDPNTRKISRTSENPIVIVQNDHNSERCSFEIPREIDGHDMTLCNNVRIHFLNADVANPTNVSKGVYEATDLDVLDIDPNTLLFTWLIHRNSTIHAGPLNFAISFQCTSEKIEADGSKSIIVEYEWNTLPDTEDISVSGGMDNSEVIAGEDYYDVVDTWLATITNLGETTKAEITSHANQEKLAVESSIEATGATVKRSIGAFAEEVKSNLGKQALSDTGVMVQETGTATDKVMSQDATTKAVEAAKTFASSEVVNAESTFNQKHSVLEDQIVTIANNSLYKKINSSVTGGWIGLELGKAYLIKTVTQPTNGWGFEFLASALLKGYTEATSNSFRQELTTYIPADKFLPVYEAVIGDVGNGLGTVKTNFIVRLLQASTSFNDSDSMDNVTIKLLYDTNNGDVKEITDHVLSMNGQGLRELELSQFNLRVHAIDNNEIEVYEMYEPGGTASVTIDANGISNISKTGTSGLKDTYTIVLDDGTTKNFTVTNGDGIKSVTTPEYDDYETTYLVTFDSGATFSFKAPNANSIGIKTPVTGTVIRAEDVIPAEHRISVKVRSKNLIKYPYISQNLTVNGITFTTNDDQSVTVTGSVPTTGLYAAYKLADVTGLLEDGKTYRIGGSNKILFAYKDASGTTKYVRTGAFTWSNTYTFVQLYLQYQSTDGEINETIYPYLYVEGESDGYTPYVDVSTVKLTRCGKNMVDITKAVGIGAGDKISIANDSITIGTGNSVYGVKLMHDRVCLAKGETYTLKCNLTGVHHADQWGWRLFTDDGTSVILSRSSELTYTPTKDIVNVNFYIAMGTAISEATTLSNIQIEKGPVATDYEPYSGVEYDVYSNGQPTSIVTSVSPKMTLFTDKPGTIIDAVYNVNQTDAAYTKLRPKATRIPLAPGTSYILQPDHMYFIHGYGDNSLKVLNAVNDENALPEIPAASDIQAMITSNGDGTNYGQIFLCHVKDNAVLIYSDNGDMNMVSWKPTKIEQIFAPKTKVKNTHATENAYVYDYGCP